MIAIHDARQRLRRRQRTAVARIDVADLAFGNHDQRLLVNAVLPREESRVQPAAKKLGLKTRLSLQSDDAAFGQRTFGRPEFLDNADLVVRNVANPGEPGDQKQRHHNSKCPTSRMISINAALQLRSMHGVSTTDSDFS